MQLLFLPTHPHPHSKLTVPYYSLYGTVKIITLISNLYKPYKLGDIYADTLNIDYNPMCLQSSHYS